MGFFGSFVVARSEGSVAELPAVRQASGELRWSARGGSWTTSSARSWRRDLPARQRAGRDGRLCLRASRDDGPDRIMAWIEPGAHLRIAIG
jgi:hypothetical protein